MQVIDKSGPGKIHEVILVLLATKDHGNVLQQRRIFKVSELQSSHEKKMLTRRPFLPFLFPAEMS